MNQTDGAGDIDAALEPMRQQLNADGYGLRTQITPNQVLEVEVVAEEGACEECLIPKDLFGTMLGDQLGEAGATFADIRVSYPTDH